MGHKKGWTKAELCEAACIDGLTFDEIADAAGVTVLPSERGDIPLNWKAVAMRLSKELDELKQTLAGVPDPAAFVQAAKAVLNAAHLRTHGFDGGDISDLDFSKMLPAIVALDAAFRAACPPEQGGNQ